MSKCNEVQSSTNNTITQCAKSNLNPSHDNFRADVPRETFRTVDTDTRTITYLNINGNNIVESVINILPLISNNTKAVEFIGYNKLLVADYIYLYVTGKSIKQLNETVTKKVDCKHAAKTIADELFEAVNKVILNIKLK